MVVTKSSLDDVVKCLIIMSEEQQEEETNEEEEIEVGEEDLESKLKTQQEELEKLKKKDYNFKAIKDRVDEQQEIIDNLKKEKESATKEKTVSDTKEKVLDELVGDDIELGEKVLHYYNRMKVDEDDAESVKSSLADSLILAKKTDSVQNPIGKAANIDSNPPGIGSRRNAAESQDSKELRRKFKISDKEKDQYSGDGWTPQY